MYICKYKKEDYYNSDSGSIYLRVHFYSTCIGGFYSGKYFIDKYTQPYKYQSNCFGDNKHDLGLRDSDQTAIWMGEWVGHIGGKCKYY